MAALGVSQDFVVISSPSEVTVVYKYPDNRKKLTLTVPEFCDDKKSKSVNASDHDIGSIIVKISLSGRYLSVCSGKKLTVWCTHDWTISSSRDIVRTASNIIFTPSETHIILADKSGDVYSFPLTNEEPATLLLGHLSVVLDVVVSDEEKCIITCDRDEKIRVSNYPNAYNVHSFCLGHKEFVSSLALVPHDKNILVSGSGDGTVKFWNYFRGVELHSFSLDELPSNVISTNNHLTIAVSGIVVLKRDCSSSLICLTIPQTPRIITLLLNQTDDKLICNFHSFIDIVSEPISFCISDSQLWILSVESKVELSLYEWSSNEDIFINRKDFVQTILTNFDLASYSSFSKKQESLDYLYKKKYDNIQEYLIKKKARLEAAS